MSFMVYIYLLACILYVYIGLASYLNDSTQKLNRLFLILCVQLALWSFMLALMHAVPDAETATFFRRTASFFWSMTYCVLLHFFLVLTQKDSYIKKPLYAAVFYVPAAVCIYLYYFMEPVGVSEIVKIPYGWAYINNHSHGFIWDHFYTLYYTAYVLISLLVVYDWGKKSQWKRERSFAAIVISTVFTVLIIGSIADIILPYVGITRLPPLTVIIGIVPIYGIWYSIKRYRIMNLSPQNVVMDVMKTMNEGMVITNRSHVIQELNSGALKMLGYEEWELKNKRIESIFPDELDIGEISECGKNELFLKKKNNEKLPVHFSSSALIDEWGEPYGSVIIFKDLTDIKKIQKELRESYEAIELKVLERTKELNHVNHELKNEIKSRIKMEREIRKLAYFDHLTGLPNRKLFMDYLNKKIQENLRKEDTLAVMFLDLDSFKMINDTMGHTQGDKLLKLVAQRLVETLRVSDTIGHIGGDEFLILIHNNPEVHETQFIATRIADAFMRPFILDGNEVHVTASIGIAIYPVDGEDADALIKNADIAMYRAKEKGKNKVEICTAAMKVDLAEMMKLTNNLYRAVERGEFELYYQPQVEIKSGNIIGFEALIRWKHPKLGMISPGRFISIAEKTGLIISIGEWVLETAMRQNKVWSDQGIISVPVAVNLSIRQFMDYDIVGTVSRILNKTGLEAHLLELEITESVLAGDIASIHQALEELSQLGVRISIDDFGTEYSSLNYLKQFPINRVKIDMNFIQGISLNPRDEAIVDAIIKLADKLGIDVLAEGVETPSQREFLRKTGCNVIQGFLSYRPMSAHHIEKLFSDGRKATVIS